MRKLLAVMYAWMLMLMLALAGCGGGGDSGSTPPPSGDVAKYAGTYSGTWKSTSGSYDTGTFTVTINSSGVISGSGSSDYYGGLGTASGQVDASGNANIAFGTVSNGAKFGGTINTNGVISGTWQASDNSGTYTGQRKEGPISSTPTSAPTVTVFSIPSTSTTLAVAITTFTATDATGVTGYLLTESSSTPAATASGWSATKPTSYTFNSVGTKTLYAWAKNAAGLVSSSKSATVTITTPTTTTKSSTSCLDRTVPLQCTAVSGAFKTGKRCSDLESTYGVTNSNWYYYEDFKNVVNLTSGISVVGACIL